VLNEHNTVFARSDPLYATGVSLGPPFVDANGISITSAVIAGLTRCQTDKLTDHATRSVTIGGAHRGEAKFCYCLRLQGVSLGPPVLDANGISIASAVFCSKS